MPRRNQRSNRSNARTRLRLLAVAPLMAALPTLAPSTAGAQESASSRVTSTNDQLAVESKQTDRLSQRIAALIEQLGSDSYSLRLQAQSELERIGVLALDQLHAASFHADPQVASIARFMVQSNQFNWAWDTDPFTVRRILALYSTAPLYDKSVYIDQLNRLDNDEGLGALCRIIRYETQGCLAKRAALLVMRAQPQLDQTLGERQAAIGTLLDGAKSVAGTWVLRFVSEPTTSAIPAWNEAIQNEQKLVESKSPDSSNEIVADLKQWFAEQIASDPATRMQAMEIARSLVLQYSGSGFGRQMKAIEFAQWALQCKLPEVVQEQHDKLDDFLVTDPHFGYLLAESYELQGKPDLAEAIAKKAGERVMMNSKGDVRERVPAGANDLLRQSQELQFAQRNISAALDRAEMGEFLEKRGRYKWAESEYRAGIKPELTEFASILAIASLSKMLHELERDDEAAEVLSSFVKRLEKEPMFKLQASELANADGLLSNYYYFLGEAAARKSEFGVARTHFLRAFEIEPDNIDALISLYRIPNDSAEEQNRSQMYQKAVGILRGKIESLESTLRQASSRNLATERRLLANELNSLAWLLTNTEGDKEEALQLSRKACGMSPGFSAYHDTHARCLASLGRYREALVQQRKAIAIDPHEMPLLRSLKEYESKVESEKQ